MKRGLIRTAFLGVLWLIASAHVGSPDTWFEGQAGPYHVIVQVTPAGVVPGVAVVHVRVIGDNVSEVSIQGDKFDATGGAPPPESAPPVAGDEGLFAGKLWIMSPGSNSVIVSVKGAKGDGSVIVPVVATASSTTPLGKPMGAALLGMGAVLFIGLVTIIGASVREGSLAPGEPPTLASRRRARNAMAVSSVLLAAIIFSGWKWWTAEDASFVSSLYKPLSATASIAESDSIRTITVSIDDSAWVHRNDTAWLQHRNVSRWTPLVEDHGKLMHAFAIREDMAAFAHLHPTSSDSVSFSSPLPPLPSGRYRVFADIVHESGFTHTMVTSLDVPGPIGGKPVATGNADDSWLVAPVAAGTTMTLEDGSTIEWKRSSTLVSGNPVSLSFEVKNADGTPASLEAYMGMAGHAVVMRDDGSVFIHLHPMGTISMASQMAFQMREPGDTIRGLLGKRVSSHAEMSSMAHSAVTSNTVSFPYAFPKSGEYRIWIQVKKQGKIITGAFDALVAEGTSPN